MANKKNAGFSLVELIIVIAILGGGFAAAYFTGLLDGILGVSKSSPEYPVWAFAKAIQKNDTGLVDEFIAEPVDSNKEANKEYVSFVKEFIKGLAEEAEGAKIKYEIKETTEASSSTLSEAGQLYKDLTEAKNIKAKLIMTKDGKEEAADFTFIVVKQNGNWKLYDIK